MKQKNGMEFRPPCRSISREMKDYFLPFFFFSAGKSLDSGIVT